MHLTGNEAANGNPDEEEFLDTIDEDGPQDGDAPNDDDDDQQDDQPMDDDEGNDDITDVAYLPRFSL